MNYRVLKTAVSQLEVTLNDQAASGWVLVACFQHHFETIDGEAEIITIWSK